MGDPKALDEVRRRLSHPCMPRAPNPAMQETLTASPSSSPSSSSVEDLEMPRALPRAAVAAWAAASLVLMALSSVYDETVSQNYADGDSGWAL